MTQDKKECTRGCPHRPAPQQNAAVPQLSHSLHHHIQILRLVVPQTYKPALGLARAAEIKQADVPTLLYELLQVGHSYMWAWVPSTLEPLLQWQ